MNIYLIESPFQLLQAYELISDSSQDDDMFFIRKNNIEQNNKQIDYLCDFFEIKNKKIINTRIKALTLIYLIPFVCISLWSKKIIIGDENSFLFRVVKKIIRTDNFLILDDGVSSLSKKSLKGYKRFTIFDEIQGEKNSFKKCRELIQFSNKLSDKVHVVIGSKLVEENICTQASYFEILSKIKKDLESSGGEIIYVPHRGEKKSNTQAINKKFGFKIENTNLPIELIGVDKHFDILSINSIISTALYSMSLIYPNARINVYELDVSNIFSRREAILELYELMKKKSEFNFN